MICVLGVSHKDLVVVEWWLRWAGTLAHKGEAPYRLLVVATRRLNIHQIGLLRESSYRLPNLSIVTLPDEHEAGYPISASHLFLGALTLAEQMYPKEAALWLEGDAIPMRPNWVPEIEREYLACGKPFMGHIEREHGPAHMAGVAVYPHDWRERAPLLADVMNAPDIFWGPGRGQAFDTYASAEILPQAASSMTIQQIWHAEQPMTRKWMLANIRPETALFHRDKSGSLIKLLKRGEDE